MWIALFAVTTALALSFALGALILGSYEEKPIPRPRVR